MILFLTSALKESGYESDSTLVFRRREDAALQLNPHDQKEAYKSIQRGGEVPLHGLRKPAPERPKGKCICVIQILKDCNIIMALLIYCTLVITINKL